jgi:hypothetical protein
VAESPSFESALLEVSDICYGICYDQLRRNVYTFEHGAGAASARTNSPPLASLLPQIKAIASSLLPNDLRSVDIREISSGPILEALCVSVFDAEIDDGDTASLGL